MLFESFFLCHCTLFHPYIIFLARERTAMFHIITFGRKGLPFLECCHCTIRLALAPIFVTLLKHILHHGVKAVERRWSSQRDEQDGESQHHSRHSANNHDTSIGGFHQARGSWKGSRNQSQSWRGICYREGAQFPFPPTMWSLILTTNSLRLGQASQARAASNRCTIR